MVAFAVHTGLRRREIAELLRDCVDYGQRESIVKRNFCHKTNKRYEYTKWKTIRQVPMKDMVFEVLAQFRLLQPNLRVV